MMSASEVQPSNLRDVARMNIHGIVRCVEGGNVSVGNPKGLHYVWKPGGEARWRDLQKLLHKLERDHKIEERAKLEDAVDAAASIYHGRGALPKDDAKQLLKSISEVTEILCDENIARIADILMDRDNRLIKTADWSKDVNGSRVDSFMKLETVSLFSPTDRRMNRDVFDGWEWSYERRVAVWFRLLRIRGDLSELASVVRRLPEGRQGDRKLLGAVALLERRWKTLAGKKVGKAKFVGSVMVFIDRNIATKLPSAMRRRLKGL